MPDWDSDEDEMVLTRLIVEQSCRGFPSGKIIRITKEKFSVGRSTENDFQIHLPVVSKKHFTLERLPIIDQWRFTCFASKSVALVNGIVVDRKESHVLRHNDRLQFVGLVTFVFKCRPGENNSLDNSNDEPFCVIPYRSNPSPEQSPRESTLSISTISQCRSDINDYDYLVHNVPIPPLSPTYDIDTNYSFSFDANYSVPAALDDHEISTALNDLKSVARDCYEWFNENVDIYRYKSTADEILIRHYDSLLKYLKLFDQLKIVDNVAIAESNCGGSDCVYSLIVHATKLNIKRQELVTILEEAKCKSDFERTAYHFKVFLWATLGESSKQLKEFIEKNMESGRVQDDTTWNKLKSICSCLDAKVKRIDMLLEERDKLKIELESIKEENESLTCKATEMKKKVSKAEVLELEYECLKESTKYREDDKRNKDALETTIANLQNDVNTIKNDKEKLSNSVTELERKYSDLENKNTELEQKCESLELTLKEQSSMARTSIACSSGVDNDVLNDVKNNWLELMESHFNCSICGEMFIEPTVTNCNHVFCAYCIKEWKKKKKICPFCRSPLKTECKATFIDDYITSLLKTMSDSAYNERLKMIDDRKAAKTPIPAKRARMTNVRRVANVEVL